MNYGYGGSYGYNTVTPAKPALDGAGTAFIVCAVLAVAAGIVLYFTFLDKKNDGKFKGFLGFLYNFLTFKTLSLELILKICYLIAASFTTLYSLYLISVNFFSFLILLILGNLVIRIVYELVLLQILMYRRVSNIEDELKKKK